MPNLSNPGRSPETTLPDFSSSHWSLPIGVPGKAAKIADLGEFFSSPGMVSEGFSLLRAEGLTKVGEGGGTDGEEIAVNELAEHNDVLVLLPFRGHW